MMRIGSIFIVGLLAGMAAPDPVAIKIQGPDTAGNPLAVTLASGGIVPQPSTPVTASSTGAASALTETLTGSAGKFTYISGFEVTGAGATGASVITVSVTGTVGGTLNFSLAIPAGTTTAVSMAFEFTTPIQSSAVNTNIVLNVPSFGAGNTNAAATAHGFVQ